jgi:signal transduction histidine kinase
VQLLEGAGGRAEVISQDEAFRLILEQTRRIRSIVDGYERLGRVEPLLSLVALNDVVRRVTGLQRFAAGDAIDLQIDLAEPLPRCHADPDLLAGALENLLRNAVEAMPKGGVLRVQTLRDSRTACGVVLRIEDTGLGIDARHAERVFDDFYTTKPTGSGIGLAFVRRVALAHGGDVSLRSRPGKGTIVDLRLPADEDDANRT